MNIEFLKKAHERVPSVPVLVNLISKREKQLIAGEKPLVMPESSEEDKVDTALREVAEGKLISEIDFDAIARAEELARNIEGAWIAGQFDNPENPRAHARTTGPEIWEDAEGRVDILVAGVGTGGTLSGAAAYLKEKNPALLAVAVEPADSPLLSCGRAGAHGLQGIGANFVPDNLDRAIIDEIVTVSTEEAYTAARALARTEGIVCGISSGAALHAAATLAAREENRGKRIAVVLPDTGERYLSTGLFE